MSLPRHIFNHSIIWLVLPVVVILALYVSVGRYFFPLLENYRDDLVLWANDQLAINLQIDQLDGQWNDFDPYIRLDQIAVYAPQVEVGQDIKPAIEVRNFSLELDSFNSFRYQFPVIRQASIQGVTLRLNQDTDASWYLNGWRSGGEASTADADKQNKPADSASLSRRSREQIREDVAPITRLLGFLLRQQHLKMEHVWLELNDRYGREYRAYSRRLEVYDVDGKQRLQGQLQLDPASPQQIAFIMEISGDPFDQSSLKVELYLQADSQSLSSWLEKVAHLLPFEIPELQGGIELWSSWQGGRLQSLKGTLQDGALKLMLPEQPEIQLTDLNSTLFWQRKRGGWEFIADNLSFGLQGRSFVLDQLLADITGDSWRVQLSSLDLKEISETLLEWPQLPERARDALVRLKPRGKLQNVTATQTPDKGFLLKTDIQAVSVDAYYGAPVLRNVHGYVESSTDAGFIRFHSDEFFMAYPELYSGGWWFDKALGEVHWQIGDALRVFGYDLQMNREGTEIAGEFDLLQSPASDDLFYLNVALTDAEERFGLRLVPDLIVPGSLTEWLDSSIESAGVTQGGFIYDGTLNLNAESPVREIATLLLLDVEQGELKFLPDWPQADALNAQVRLDGTELDVDLDSGRYLGNEGISGLVTLRDDDIGSVVGLNLKGDIIPEWGWQVFTKTPLKDLVPESLLHWKLSGQPLGVKTALEFPIDGRGAKGEVSVAARDTQLLIPELATPVEHLKGTVVYDVGQGLMVEQAQAEFLGDEVSFGIKTDKNRGAVIVSGSGIADIETINRWQPMPFSPWLSGALNYEFSVDLDRVSRLHLVSDLEGVDVNLPEPIGKKAESRKPLLLEMSFASEANRFSVAYDQSDSPGFLLSNGIWGGVQEGYGVGVWYGDATRDAKPLLNSSQRTDLFIRRNNFDLEPWAIFASEQFARQALTESVSRSGLAAGDENVRATSDEADVGSQPVRVHFASDKVVYKDAVINDLTIDAEMAGDQIEASLASQQLEGIVRLSPEIADFNMKRVFLAPADETDSKPLSKADRKKLFGQLFDSAWPDFNLKIADFTIFGVSGQKLAAEYRTDRASRQINLANLSQGSVDFSGALDWLVDSETESTQAQTSLILNIKGGDLKDVQTSFGVPAAVTSSKSDSSIRLGWQGLPHDVKSETLNGQVNVYLEKGAFEQVQSVPALKLLSLFNFESLVRRLQLDFSDLSGKGLSYDEVTGQVVLKDGIGVIKEPIQVEGSATKFEMTGQFDFIEEKFDQEMVVTLPVGETLPFAAILAGAPQVGGTIYIIQKVFGNLFDKFTQATYTIKGDWDEPQIELKRVF